jgi:hypothetical protein
MSITQSAKFLRTVLLIDAATCVATGLLMTLGADIVAGLTAVPAPLLLYGGLSLVWAFYCQAVSERRSLFLAFFTGFFVRPGKSRFFAPDPQHCKAVARRSCQGWPSHQPFHELWTCQAIP